MKLFLLIKNEVDFIDESGHLKNDKNRLFKEYKKSYWNKMNSLDYKKDQEESIIEKYFNK